MPKRSRRELSLKEKYDLIQASERIPKPTQKDLAFMFEVGKTTTTFILRFGSFLIRFTLRVSITLFG
jgi:hypothetical protein